VLFVPCVHATLAAALAAAAPGDTVLVQPGTWRTGPLVVQGPLTLLGRGRAEVVGQGDHTILTVRGPGVVVDGLTFRHVRPSGVEDRAAIRVDGASGCRITNNEIRDAHFGIHVGQAAGCVVARNRVTGPGRRETGSGNAIHLWSSEDLTVEDNEVTGHRDGLYLEFVRRSRLARNVSHGNRRYGMHFMYSDSCAYEDNVFRANGVGVAVMYTKRVTMTGNRFEDSRGQAAFGLLLKDITDSRIEDNRFTGNTVGLYLEGSDRQAVRGNRFTGNGWAVRVLANAAGNRFEGNVFVGNAFDVTTNSRSAASTFHGNYWDRYRGFDLDRDGRGDVPFRPVRLFALVVERHPPALALLRSAFVDLLDQAERLLPLLTPEALRDDRPLMEPPR
jgi:nitrous oxidase accessory protein